MRGQETGDLLVIIVGGLGAILIGAYTVFSDAGRRAALLGFLGDVVVGLVVGVVIVTVGFLLLGVASVLIEVGERRVAQLPAHLRAVPPLAPRTLRWVGGLLPGGEGTAWLAEVTSCLAEVPDKSTRRRYVRSYRRGVPRLIWISWAEYLSASHRRKLS